MVSLAMTPLSGHGKAEWPLTWGRVIIINGNNSKYVEGLLWARHTMPNALHTSSPLIITVAMGLY